jgi:hypothetical protein
MADVTTTAQIMQESPRIEEAKLRLMEEAERLAFGLPNKAGVVAPTLGSQLPAYQVAGFSPAQQAALSAAAQQGIGAYNPYMTNANRAVQSAYTTTGEAADVLRGADTRNQFFDAQAAMRQAGQAAANTTAGIGQVNEGLSYLDSAARRTAMSDTTDQFGGARQDLQSGLGALSTAQNMAAGSSQANLNPATTAISQGIGGLSQAQQMAMDSRAADFGNSQRMMGIAADQLQGAQPQFDPANQLIGYGVGQGQQAVGMAARAAQQPGFFQAQDAITQGLGALGGGMQGYNPNSAQAFMDPYRQQVIDETMKQMDRQNAIAGQGLSAQAVRSGAFGGEREGVQRAEMQRNLMDQKSATIANLLSQGYSQAQAGAMSAFEQQQQRQLQGGQAAGSLGSQLAGVASQAGGLGQQAAQIAAQQGQLGIQAGTQLGSLEAQRAQLGQSGAGQLANIGQQFGSQAAQQAQLGQAASGLYGNFAQQQVGAGQGLGQLGVQQAQLGQGAAGQFLQASQQYGNLASQGGALAGQESAINQNISNLLLQQSQARNQAAQTAGGLYGQQGQQFQQLGQGIGSLASQQFGIGQQQAQGLGAMAGQLGQLGVQQAALGQTAQTLQQGDINFLYNTGQAQQALNQQGLDAQRATSLQQTYAPYQQAAFLSDIYKGAPSSQMQTAIQSQPSASPFQQALGIGLGALSTVAGAKKAGLF